MSFLDSVPTSLQTGNPSQAPLSQRPAPPATPSTVKKVDPKPAAPTSRPAANGNASGGIKRKAEAEDQLPRPSRPDGSKSSTLPSNRAPAPFGTPRNVPKPASTTNPKPASPGPALSNGPGTTTNGASAKSTPTKAGPSRPAAAPSKPPLKGSFADIMAKAKAVQEQAPKRVGIIGHQIVPPKERISKVERKRRLMEAKAKEKAARRFGPKSASGAWSKGKTAVKNPEPELPAYKGTAKPPGPRMSPEAPAYRGTAGLPARSGNDRRAHGKRRTDEYLGTDEEDEGGYGGYDDYYSDASSDMEAGFDDVEGEEDAALKFARKEDEKEMAMEMAAKQEKLQRQKRLAALASRAKR